MYTKFSIHILWAFWTLEFQKGKNCGEKVGSSKIQNSIRHYLPNKQRRQIAVFHVKFFVNANSRSKFEDLWRCNVLLISYSYSPANCKCLTLSKSQRSLLTTENCQVWPLFGWVSIDNSAPRISQSCSKMPFFSKALCVDRQVQRPKRLTDLKSAWKTA